MRPTISYLYNALYGCNWGSRNGEPWHPDDFDPTDEEMMALIDFVTDNPPGKVCSQCAGVGVDRIGGEHTCEVCRGSGKP